MARELGLLLQDILEAAADAVRYASDMTENGFQLMPARDRDKFRAVKNAVTELGEAVGKLPADIKDRHPEVDWAGMVGMRNIVTHQYFGVDMTRLWPVLADELPVLIGVLEQEARALSDPDHEPEDSSSAYKG